MRFTGKLKPPHVDYESGRMVLLFEPEEECKEGYETLKGYEKLSLELKPYRKKRSLVSNSYFHVLLGKLANVLHTSNPEIKNRILCEYGELKYSNDRIVSFFIDDEIDVSEYEHLHLRPTSHTCVIENGRVYREYLEIRGTHTYNSKEMAKLIAGTISECREAGIPEAELMTANEKAEFLEKWGIEIG